MLVNDTITFSGLSPAVYNLSVTDANGCVVATQHTLSNPNNPCYVTLSLKLFIQGFYHSPAYMNAVIDPVTSPGICDTTSVELHDFHTPFSIQYKTTCYLDTTGNSQVVFPGSAWMNNYYIVVNSIETWSKYPVQLGEFNYFDFTVNPGPAFKNFGLKTD